MIESEESMTESQSESDEEFFQPSLKRAGLKLARLQLTKRRSTLQVLKRKSSLNNKHIHTPLLDSDGMMRRKLTNNIMRQSTVMANAVIKRRIKEGQKSLKKLTVAMKHFIEQKEIQI